MAKRTRVFLLAASGVLMVGLVISLVAWAMRVPVLAALPGAPEELAYVPETARMVAYADMRQVMQSQFHDKLRQLQRSATPNANSLEARTGINFERDIDRVLVAYTAFAANGTGNGTGNGAANGTATGTRGDNSLTIARGRFDQAKIESFMTGQGALVEQYRGKKLSTMKQGATDVALSFAETGLVLFGSGDLVRRALDTKAGGIANISTNAEFMGFVAKVQDTTAWTVAKFDSVAGDTGLPPAVAANLPPITWLIASGRLDTSLHGLVRAEALDEKAAQDLRDVVQGFLALARLQAGRSPEIQSLLNAVMLSSEGKSVSLSFEVTPALLDLLTSGNTLRRPGTPTQPANPQERPQRF